MVGFLEEAEGVRSAGRLISLMAAALGIVIVLFALVLIAVDFAGDAAQVGQLIGLVALGIGVFGSGEALKATQKMTERRDR